MDRNTLIGLLLIAAIIITWNIFTDTPEKPEGTGTTTEIVEDDTAPDLTQPKSDTTGQGLTVTDGDTTITDSLQEAQQQAEVKGQFGPFWRSAEGEGKLIHVVTDKYDLTLNSHGAWFKDLTLQEYKTSDSLPLPIIADHPGNVMNMVFKTYSDGGVHVISSQDLYFETKAPAEIEVLSAETADKGDEETTVSKSVRFRAYAAEDQYIEKVYTFYSDRYDIDLQINVVGLGNIFQDGFYQLSWSEYIPRTEREVKLMKPKTALYYRSAGDVDDLPGTDDDFQEEKLSTTVDWISFKSQFFSHSMLAPEDRPFDNVKVAMATLPDTGRYFRKMDAEMTVDYNRGPQESFDITMFAGPNEFYTLQSYDRKLDRQLGLGWGPIKFINAYFIIPIFKFLEGVFTNYGLIIFLMALIIKVIIFPMTYKIFLSGAKMRVVNQMPEVKELEEKYKDNPTKLSQEKMVFYGKVGASPFSGCLPMLLQYPILIAMFWFFPESIELRQESFLWADDLSTYDAFLRWEADIPIINLIFGHHLSLFTLLMTISVFVYTLMNQKNQASMANNPAMKYFPYIMPLIFLGLLNNYSAGLSFYYLVSNLLSISQTFISKAFINDEKVMAKVRATKSKKGNKKGRIQKWLESQQKMQQEAMKNRNKGRR